MADEEKKEEEAGAGEEAPKKSKKPLFLGGGIVGLVAAAYIVSMVALPGESTPPPFDGPFIVQLTDGDVQVNLKGNNGSRYLVMSLRAEYFGYDETYVTTRVADAVYQANMVDALIGLGRQRTMADVEDAVGEETLKEEIREAVDPLLFPIHVGNAAEYLKPHAESGVGPGRSIERSTMRGGFQEHVISVNAIKGEIKLDEGELQTFDGTEDDFMLVNQNGLTVFVDLTGVPEDFVGELNVGTFGRVRKILNTKFLTQ